MTGIPSVPLIAGLVAALAALIWAAASDLRSYVIPNRASGLVCAAYLTALAWMPLQAWLLGFGVGVASLLVGATLFARGWVGGGDVKLASAIALWAGPGFLSDFALATAVSGAALAAAMLSPLWRLMPWADNPQGGAGGLKQPMPFGAPLAVGGAWVLVLHLTTNL